MVFEIMKLTYLLIFVPCLLALFENQTGFQVRPPGAESGSLFGQMGEGVRVQHLNFEPCQLSY